MKFYGGQSSCANETENDKKYSSIFHDLKFSYYYVFIKISVNCTNLIRKKKKRKENIFNIRLRRMFNLFF